MNDSISWVHFGDLHIQQASNDNYLDFLDLIEEANHHLAGQVDFAFLPGDNAEDGTEEQYSLVRGALERLRLPVHIIAGDHDRKGGSLDPFQSCLQPALFRAVDVKNFRLLFLNALDGPDAVTFDFSQPQISWLETQLSDAQSLGLRPLVFSHLYPSELATQGTHLTNLIQRFGVELVEMGHTHYNELANDGQTIYATTRSTGQIEEGPPGFSITCINEDVISWKFRTRGTWPFVMIVSPADEKLITKPDSARHLVRGSIAIRAKVYGQSSPAEVMCSIDDGAESPMEFTGHDWKLPWNTESLPDGLHRIRVRVAHAIDEINVLTNQQGHSVMPPPSKIDYENAIGAYPLKGILGTQLGPNENGTKGPWPSWR